MVGENEAKEVPRASFGSCKNYVMYAARRPVTNATRSFEKWTEPYSHFSG